MLLLLLALVVWQVERGSILFQKGFHALFSDEQRRKQVVFFVPKDAMDGGGVILLMNMMVVIYLLG